MQNINFRLVYADCMKISHLRPILMDFKLDLEFVKDAKSKEGNKSSLHKNQHVCSN